MAGRYFHDKVFFSLFYLLQFCTFFSFMIVYKKIQRFYNVF